MPFVIAESIAPPRLEVRVSQVVLDTATPRHTVRISSGGYTVHVSRLLTVGEIEGEALGHVEVLELVRRASFLTTTVAAAVTGDISIQPEPDWSGEVRVCVSGSSAE